LGMTPARTRDSPWLVDRILPDDLEEIEAVGGLDHERMGLLRRWAEADPDQVVVVRRRAGDRAVVAVGAGASPRSLPPRLAEHPGLARWRGWVDARDDAGRALLTPLLEVLVEADAAVGTRERDLVGAALLGALAERAAVPDFRWWLCPQRPGVPDPAHCGGMREVDLDLDLDGEVTPGFAIDYGESGVVAAMRDQARRRWAVPRAGVSADDVRAALLEIRAGSTASRSELAREVAAAVDSAFGDGRDGVLLRDVVRLGYLVPGAGHDAAMLALHLSRSTYFRRLREAVGILAARLSAMPSPPSSAV
ncbi:MAG: hypothetical protein DI570_31380, partial [Phenylobacterium zucineum]